LASKKKIKSSETFQKKKTNFHNRHNLSGLPQALLVDNQSDQIRYTPAHLENELDGHWNPLLPICSCSMNSTLSKVENESNMGICNIEPKWAHVWNFYRCKL